MAEQKNIFSLKDKVIIVTGGTGVLGSSFVKAIGEAGGTVVIIDLHQDKAEEKAEELKALGFEALGLAANVLDEAALIQAKQTILDKYGKIDGLVNAAGGNVPESIIQPDQDVFDMNIEGMKKALVLNVWGTVAPTKIFGEAMKENGGSIVNISSVSPKTVLTMVMGYSMGKAAIDIYTKWFAVEVAKRYGDKIRMNAIAPGFFLTHQNKDLLTNPDGSYKQRSLNIMHSTPYNRFGQPDELNGALIYLLSDASKFVTAAEIAVDGGFTKFSGV